MMAVACCQFGKICGMSSLTADAIVIVIKAMWISAHYHKIPIGNPVTPSNFMGVPESFLRVSVLM